MDTVEELDGFIALRMSEGKSKGAVIVDLINEYEDMIRHIRSLQNANMANVDFEHVHGLHKRPTKAIPTQWAVLCTELLLALAFYAFAPPALPTIAFAVPVGVRFSAYFTDHFLSPC